MRVIAGSARRMVLKSLDGTDTRPTLDRYKETLFNTIQTYVPDSFFIDVCAGTGAIGIEALSRGADRAVFIENNRKAISVIEENLQRTHLADRAEVLTADAVTGLMQTEKKGPADVIYIDPPYNTGNEGWVYNDNVNDPRIRKWLGQVVGKEGEDLSRHDKWLCMMYPRLRLLQKLLAEDGVIFISIDDAEYSGSKLVGEDTLIVVEASNETELDYLDALGFNIIKTKEYRTNKHVFIMKG